MCEAFVTRPWLVALIDHVAMGGVGLVLLVCVPLAYWVLGRPFDRAFKNGARAGPEYWLGWLSTFFFRPMTYAVRVIVDTPRGIRAAQQSELAPYVWERMDYGDFNFRLNATAFQKMFSYVYVGTTMFLIFFVAPVLEICDL